MLDHSRSDDRRFRARFDMLLVVLVAGVLAVLAAPLLWRSAHQLYNLLQYAYPHDGLEGTLLHEAGLLWSGEPLYQPLERYRFVSAPYPPLHPVALGLAIHWPGTHPFWTGRLISLVMTLGACAIAARLIFVVGRSWWAALCGVILLLSMPPVILWATRVKPDMLAFFFTTLGLFLATIALQSEEIPQREQRGIPRRRALLTIGAAVCFVAALFTKHTALAAPLATGLAFLSSDHVAWRRPSGPRLYWKQLPRTALLFGVTYLLLGGSIWLLVDGITGGQYSFHVITMHEEAAWSAQLMRNYLGLLTPYWPLMLLSAVQVGLAFRHGRGLVVGWYVLIVPFTLVGSGKTGANHNHLLETMLALCLAGGSAAGWAWQQLAPHAQRAVPLLALLAVQFVLSATPPEWYRTELSPGEPPLRFVEYLKNTPGEVLADDTGLLYFAGKPLRYDDPSTMGPVADVGLWDQSGLVEDIANRRFSAIIIPVDVAEDSEDSTGRWTPTVLDAIREHYQLQFRDVVMVYVPRATP